MINSLGNYFLNVNGLSGAFQNYYDSHADYGLAGYDVTHNLPGVAVYALPFGRGKQLGSRVNRLVDALIGGWSDLSKRPNPRRNLLDLMFDPYGMRPIVEDWDSVASGLLQRVYREAVGHVTDKKTTELVDRLKKYPGVEELSVARKSHAPVLPITFIRDSERVSYFSMISTVGSPQDITAQEFRIECMFPAEI